MANGFRLTGDYYISKAPAGNDSNDGLTKDTPKVSIIPQSGNAIIGSGIYKYLGAIGRFFGDGVVVLDGENSPTAVDLTPTNGVLENITIKNYTLSNNVSGTSQRTINNCTFKNILGGSFGPAASYVYNNCKFINCNTTSNNSGTRTFNFAIIINSNIVADGFIYNNCYIDSNSNCFIRSGSSSALNNSNVNGILKIDGTYYTDGLPKSYAIQDQLTGTPQDNGYDTGVNWLTEAQLTSDGYTGTIAGWDAAVATCINRDPKFNNVALEDFSLQADSPHIGRATDGGNIGGTDIANTVLVNQDGVGTIEVISQPEIDTTNPNFYTVATNEDEGYIDIIQRIGTQPIVLTEIEPISTLEFDSDIAGGNVGNQNVPDSEPQTAEYPRKLTTTSLAPDTTTLNVTGHDVVVGEFVRVLGEDREVTAVTANTITVDTAFRAAVASGVTFQAGSEVQLAALRPNRLTYQLRVSTQVAKPATDAEWDNNIDPIYNYEGLFSTQEWFEKPGYTIDGSNVYGSGDAEANPAITPDEIAATWINVRVWLRNNYSS